MKKVKNSKNSDKSALISKNSQEIKRNAVIQERLKEFRRLTGTIEVDEIPSDEERKNARFRRYTSEI